jgi:hypothetical protein
MEICGNLDIYLITPRCFRDSCRGRGFARGLLHCWLSQGGIVVEIDGRISGQR